MFQRTRFSTAWLNVAALVHIVCWNLYFRQLDHRRTLDQKKTWHLN